MNTSEAAQRLQSVADEYESTTRPALLQVLSAVERHRDDRPLGQAAVQLHTAQARLLTGLGRLAQQLPFCGSTFVEMPRHLQRPHDALLLAAEQQESERILLGLCRDDRDENGQFCMGKVGSR
jgi:hypothetical protein